MAKQSGLGDRLYVHGYNLSGDTGSLQRIGGGPAALDVTDITQSAYQRIGGERTGEITWSSWFNPAANQAHARYKGLPATDVILTYGRGATLGNPAACMVAKQVNYDGSRGDDGSLMFALNAVSNGYGIEWGRQLTAGPRTDTGATNGSSIDDAASSAFGLQAYLHVTAFSGTDVTVRIQESSDDGAGDAFANVTGGAFTQITSSTPTAERIATATNLAVERYLRVVTATTGGFSSLSFVVVVVRNATAPAF